MIDFNLCKQCADGEWQAPVEDEDGEAVIMPSVECGLSHDILLMNSNPPPQCPYKLAHKVSTQVVPRGFANYMSGVR